MLNRALQGATAAADKLYIEDVMSTFLYTGNGSTQTITNGIDLSGKGGLVWIKKRDGGTGTGTSHQLYDTVRTARRVIQTNLTDAQETTAGGEGLTVFTGSGFTLGTNYQGSNEVDKPTVSWTFRNQPKFFDIVTYTGTGGNRTIAHNLGSVPGCIIIKRLSGTATEWAVYHRSLANTEYIVINTTAQKQTGATQWWNSTTPTSSVFSLGTSGSVNASGATYVAYLFAHDAGGFGSAGTDNVVSCGSYTGNGSATGPVVTLGYEPQWLMIKKSSDTGNWQMIDNMRGMPVGSDDTTMQANLYNGESSAEYVSPTATGFQITSSDTEVNTSSGTYIYIAIRRGPMKTPTVGTEVFSASTASTGNNTPGFVTDNLWTFYRGGGGGREVRSRLQGNTPYLVTSSDAAEATSGNYKWDTNNGVNYTWGSPYIGYYFRRAPGFFDVVAYSGGGTSVNHNLRVIPELMFVKVRSTSSRNWVAARPGGIGGYLNTSAGFTAGDTFINLSDATTTTFPINGNPECGQSGQTYIAYLFATLAGVSKVGSYTGTGTTLQVNCGFTAGARFVLIKRTNSTGGWYVWDTARGIISGNDPYLLLNLTTAEDTSTDYIDPLSSGFEISSTAPAAINANGGSFIFLAIA